MSKRENTLKPRTGRKLSALIGIILISAIIVALVLMLKNRGRTQPDKGAQAGAQPHDAVKARSGHSDYLVGLTRKALKEGFGTDAVPLLQPERGPGREVVADRLRSLAAGQDGPFGPRITALGLKPSRSNDRNIALIGPASSLVVSADGTKFSFHGNIDDPREIERARASGPLIEKDELEKIGRLFIDKALRDFVKVGLEESLTFLGAKYLRDEAISDDGKQEYKEVVSSIAVFGREVHGVPVIGSGSKVAVWFANDRQPVGFDVDWPLYQALPTRQEVLSRDQLFERVQATTVSPGGSDRIRVERFECGYVDLGATKRGAEIQGGCSIHYAGRNDDGTLWAQVEYVPAGNKVFEDPKWPLATLIAKGTTINTDTPEYSNFASTRRDPGAPLVEGDKIPIPR